MSVVQTSAKTQEFNSFLAPYQDNRSIPNKIYHIGIAFISICIRPATRLFNKDEIQLKKSHPQSKTLYVFIHGLKGSPYRWTPFIKHLESTQPNASYFVYRVPKEGNCGLKEASEPLYETLTNYFNENVQITNVCLIGTSWGSRIAARIERKLVESPLRILTVSISGVHQGTKIMTWISYWNLSSWFGFHQKVLTDLQYQSDRSLKLLKKWKNSCTNSKGERRHIFYASSTDEGVIPFKSGIVKIGEQDKHIVHHGYVHTNLANNIYKEVLETCQKWIDRF